MTTERVFRFGGFTDEGVVLVEGYHAVWLRRAGVPVRVPTGVPPRDTVYVPRTVRACFAALVVDKARTSPPSARRLANGVQFLKGRPYLCDAMDAAYRLGGPSAAVAIFRAARAER